MYGDKKLQKELQFSPKRLQRMYDESAQWMSKHNSKSKREFDRQLQELKQGSMSVEEYFHEMELAMIRVGIKEVEESTKIRFINGLRLEIAKVVEMYSIGVGIKELVFYAIIVEKRLRREKRKKEKKEAEEKRKENDRQNDLEGENKRANEKEGEKENIEKEKSMNEKKESCQKSDNRMSLCDKKEEDESECNGMSLVSNELDNSILNVSNEMQVVEISSPKKPSDGVLSSRCFEKNFHYIDFVIPEELLLPKVTVQNTLKILCYMSYDVCSQSQIWSSIKNSSPGCKIRGRIFLKKRSMMRSKEWKKISKCIRVEFKHLVLHDNKLFQAS